MWEEVTDFTAYPLMLVEAYADIEWTGNLSDMKSTRGYYVYFGNKFDSVEFKKTKGSSFFFNWDWMENINSSFNRLEWLIYLFEEL